MQADTSGISSKLWLVPERTSCASCIAEEKFHQCECSGAFISWERGDQLSCAMLSCRTVGRGHDAVTLVD